MSALMSKRAIMAARPAGAVSRPLPSALFVKPVVAQNNFIARAQGETPSIDTEKLLKDAQEKFDAIENKPQFALYSVGAVFGLWLTSQLLGFINHLPLFPKLFELIGLAYVSWFTYTYLLFKSGRAELLQDIESLKGKLAGDSTPAATPAAATPTAAKPAAAPAKNADE